MLWLVPLPLVNGFNGNVGVVLKGGKQQTCEDRGRLRGDRPSSLQLNGPTETSGSSHQVFSFSGRAADGC